MGTPVLNCDVYIQIWVDVDAIVQGGNADYVYLVDNKIGASSQNEGTNKLQTACTVGSSLGWTIQSIDPYAAEGKQLEIATIENSQAWGPKGQPQPTDESKTAFVGTVEKSGRNSYEIELNVNGNTVKLQAGVSAA